MKKVLFKKRIDRKKGTKAFSIHTRTEDKQCRTEVRKSFKYAVDLAREVKPVPKKPLVFIRKSLDTKRGIEVFSFHVKGYFYVTQGCDVVKVRFNHSLDIEIKWKIKNFSPKKSESLT